MKIICECGHWLADTTDMLSYKARFCADQDWDDLLAALEHLIAEVADSVLAAVTPDASGALDLGQSSAARDDAQSATLGQVAREQLLHPHVHKVYQLLYQMSGRPLYQCYQCGRLFVGDTAPQLHGFVPADRSTPKRLLGSAWGGGWRRPLHGSWHDGRQGEAKGELWWGGGDDESGYERFETWPELKARYHEILSHLREKEILRYASLRRGNTVVHEWPEEPPGQDDANA